VAGIEEQLKRIGAASSLRQPTPVAELRERASHIRKNRRRLTSGLLIFVAIIIFLVPLPQLHLLHGSTTSGRKTGSTIGPVGAGIPVLGEPTGAFAQGDGFGEVRPSRIYSGGDSGESLSGVVWKSWAGCELLGVVSASTTRAAGRSEPVPRNSRQSWRSSSVPATVR